MLVTDGHGTPLGTYLDSASPAEVKLLEQTLDEVPGTPQRLVADRGYDSNAVRAALITKGIEPIIPARRNNRIATH